MNAPAPAPSPAPRTSSGRPHRRGGPRRPLAADRQPALVYIASLSPGSQPTARSILEGLARLASRDRHGLETFAWHELSYRRTQKIRQAIAARWQPAGANLRLAMLRRVLDTAFALGLMGGTQYQRARMVKNVRAGYHVRGRSLDQRELGKLIATTRSAGGPRAARDVALFALLYATGARRREVVGIRWPADVDLRGGLLTLRTKGAKHRTADLQPPIVQAVEGWLEWRGRRAGPLFCAIDRFDRFDPRRALSPGALLKICRRRGDAAKLRPFAPHDLRRTFGTELLDAGIDLHVVAEMMDHEQLSTTARYDTGRSRRAHDAAARLRIPF